MQRKRIDPIAQLLGTYFNAAQVMSEAVSACGGNMAQAIMLIGREPRVHKTEIDDIAAILARMSPQQQIFTIQRGMGWTNPELLLNSSLEEVPDEVVDYIRSEDFVVSLPEESADIVLLDFGRHVHTRAVLDACKGHLYEWPWAEDALHFARTYPAELQRGRIIFLHRAWRMNNDNHVLALDMHDGKRRLRFVQLEERAWGENDRFAVIKPRHYETRTAQD